MAKIVKAAEYREMTVEALASRVKDLEMKLFNDRLKAGMGKLENTSSLRTLRKDIARAKTVLTEKAKKA
ncbi:MAG TPA: 50S ribosomal protein L29 [Sphingomonadales bacterium]